MGAGGNQQLIVGYMLTILQNHILILPVEAGAGQAFDPVNPIKFLKIVLHKADPLHIPLAA